MPQLIPVNDIGPGLKYWSITPHDSTDYVQGYARAIYVGVAGNIVVVDQDGNTATFVGVPVGTVLPVWHKRVNSTNTTASSLVALG